MTDSGRPGPIVMMAYWGPEVRIMVYSGLIERIAAEREVVLLSRVVNGDFVEHLPAGCRLEQLRVGRAPGLLGRVVALVNTAHGLRMKAAGLEGGLASDAGLNTRISSTRRLRQAAGRVVRFQPAFALLQSLESMLFERWARNAGPLQEQVRRFKPSALLSMDTFHWSARLAAEVTKQGGGTTALFSGNWKDISRGLRMAKCWDRYLVWNSSMRDNLLAQNLSCDRGKIYAVGTPQFDLHFRQELIEDRETFMARFGLDSSKPMLCFSAAAKRVVPEESRTVREICRAVKAGEILGSPSVFVRLNPTGSDPDFSELAKEFDFVRVVEARWDHRPDQPGGRWQAGDWEDTALFMNLIRHSAMNISAASTVTLDFCVLDRPVVTVAFDPPGAEIEGRSVSTFHKQDIYRAAVDLGACRLARDPATLVNEVNAYLAESRRDSAGRSAFVKHELGENESRSVDRIAGILLGSE